MEDAAGRIGNHVTDSFTDANKEILIPARFEKKSRPTGRDIEKPEA